MLGECEESMMMVSPCKRAASTWRHSCFLIVCISIFWEEGSSTVYIFLRDAEQEATSLIFSFTNSGAFEFGDSASDCLQRCRSNWGSYAARYNLSNTNKSQFMKHCKQQLMLKLFYNFLFKLFWDFYLIFYSVFPIHFVKRKVISQCTLAFRKLLCFIWPVLSQHLPEDF